MPKIQRGTIVQYSDKACQRMQDADIADMKAIVLEVVYGRNGKPPLARLLWDDDTRSSALVKNLQVWRGGLSEQDKATFGLADLG